MQDHIWVLVHVVIAGREQVLEDVCAGMPAFVVEMQLKEHEMQNSSIELHYKNRISRKQMNCTMSTKIEIGGGGGGK